MTLSFPFTFQELFASWSSEEAAVFPDTKNIISDYYSEKSSSIPAPKPAFQAPILFFSQSADLKFYSRGHSCHLSGNG